MYIPYLLHTYSIHIPYIFHAYSIHIPYIFHTDSIHFHTCSIHIPYIFHTYSMHVPYIFHTYSTHIPHIFHAYSIHIECIFHTYSIHIPCIFHTSSIHIPYVFHAYSIHIPYMFHTYSIHIPYIYIYIALFQNPLVGNFNSPSHHYLSGALRGNFLCTGLMVPGSGPSGSAILLHGKKTKSQKDTEARNRHAYSTILLPGKNGKLSNGRTGAKSTCTFCDTVEREKKDRARFAILLFKSDSTFSDVSAIIIPFTFSGLGLLWKLKTSQL